MHLMGELNGQVNVEVPLVDANGNDFVMNAQIKGETVGGKKKQRFRDFSEHVSGDVSNLINKATGRMVTQEDVDEWKSKCDMEVVERFYDGDLLNQIERDEKELENQRNEELDQDAGL